MQRKGDSYRLLTMSINIDAIGQCMEVPQNLNKNHYVAQKFHGVILKGYNQRIKRCLCAHAYCGTIHYSQDLESNETLINR